MKKTILYVDDEPINILLFEYNLKDNFSIITAESGSKGLEKLENHSEIDYVISDLSMPLMDGLEFISAARKDFPEKKYFIRTAYLLNNQLKAALENNTIHHCFSKPIDPLIIKEMLA